mmetsp:Transcript_14596/g.22515  ORF Transcript_14596/g.22515 Transcript_14596/m.22515 type:complete len:498 (+) Transcript_14596:2-1495(+)
MFGYTGIAIIFWACTTILVKGQSPEQFLEMGDKELASNALEEAVALYQKGLEGLHGDESSSLVTAISLATNLGTSLSELGKEEESVEAYSQGLRHYQESFENISDLITRKDTTAIAAQASFFLGMVYQDLGLAEKAANSYSYANTLDPMHWSSLANLGALLQDHLKQHDDALLAYNKAYDILVQTSEEPTDAPEQPQYILAELQYRIGNLLMLNAPDRKCALIDSPDQEVSCRELANYAMSLALKYDPNHEAAKHMLATGTADATMTRASNEYVKSLFDDYANNFEHSLVEELGYNGYERLRQSFDRVFDGAPPVFKLVVDAGCGTGLAGDQFRNISDILVGVDLSQAILIEAETKRPNLYNETIVADLTQVFSEKAKMIDLIIAADSYIYFGDLEQLFAAMEQGLVDGGYAAFTLEKVEKEDQQLLDTTKPEWRWKLTASGRFAHRQKYVEEIGFQHNLHLLHYQSIDNFRSENGKGVDGHIFILQKTLTPDEQEL